MAIETASHLVDTWQNLKENPVFRRSTFPTSPKSLLRNPIARALVLTMVALAAFEVFSSFFAHYLVMMLSAVVFWTLVHAIQHYFTWAELASLARTGTLEQYLNTGLRPADVCMGLIQPARISDQFAMIGLLGYFLYQGNTVFANTAILVVLLVLVVMGLFQQPTLFLPDVENYLRRRNPLALYFITFSTFVPSLIWFTIAWAILFWVLPFVAGLIGKPLDPNVAILALFGGTYFLHRYPTRAFLRWRLRRFYQRFSGVEDLLTKYVEQGERFDRG